MSDIRQKFSSAMEKLIERYPYRKTELKALALVWRVTNFEAQGGAGIDRPLPSKIPVLIGLNGPRVGGKAADAAPGGAIELANTRSACSNPSLAASECDGSDTVGGN